MLGYLRGISILGLGLAVMLVPQPGWSAKRSPFKPARVPFSFTCNGLVSNYTLQSVFVLPGEKLRVAALDANRYNEFEFLPHSGAAQAGKLREWIWSPPEKAGIYGATLRRSGDGAVIRVQCVVLVPYDRVSQGMLNGYELGEYPASDEADEGRQPPQGFVEVTPENLNAPLTPHFILADFVCSQPGAFPQYCALDARLLFKLETLLEAVNNEGYPCRTLSISCGFRTPAYNRKRGHAKYSSHLWGRAADVYVDCNGDGRMDDLSRDGRINAKDAKLLGRVVETVDGIQRYRDLVGGLGLYDEGGAAFVHVDVRGSRARWVITQKRKARSKN